MAVQPKQKKRNPARDLIVMALQLVFGVIVGVLVCGSWLVTKPVTALDSPPPASRAKTDRHEVLYVRGRVPTRSAQGAKKQKAFLSRAPGELVFVEEDVNGWLTATYGKEPRTYEVQGLAMTLGPRVPTVRLDGDEMELCLEIAVDREGGSRSLVAQARGRFVARGDHQVFVPRKIYLGSCPMPWNLGGRYLYEKLLGLHPVAENVNGAWAAVSQATVAESRLHLVVGGGAPAVPAAAVVTAPPPAAAPELAPAEPPPASTDAAPSEAPATAPTP